MWGILVCFGGSTTSQWFMFSNVCTDMFMASFYILFFGPFISSFVFALSSFFILRKAFIVNHAGFLLSRGENLGSGVHSLKLFRYVR